MVMGCVWGQLTPVKTRYPLSSSTLKLKLTLSYVIVLQLIRVAFSRNWRERGATAFRTSLNSYSVAWKSLSVAIWLANLYKGLLGGHGKARRTVKALSI